MSIPGIKHIIAVASGKGGVGKSTTSVNIALALVKCGHRVGLLDADIHGPNQPLLLGAQGARPETTEDNKIIPVLRHGVQSMSIGYLIEQDTPMIWRGPMVTGALMQLLNDTAWDNLDYLIMDLPPGTGDIQLTMAQKIPVTGAVVITTPQEIALMDVRKAVGMFDKVKVPVLGVIENMSTHSCSACGHKEAIFGAGGGQALAQKYKLKLLGSVPLDKRIREQADGGEPTVVALPLSEMTQQYMNIAQALVEQIGLQAKKKPSKFPKIVVKH